MCSRSCAGNGPARSVAEAVAVAQRIGYPVLVRPSYVLGGRAMEIVYDDGSLRDYFERAACVLPPYLIGDRQVEEMRRYTKAFAEALGVVGLINVQYAIQAGVVHVLEVNPRASRTVPFVSKATGVPLA